MDLTPPLTPSETNPVRVGLPVPVDAYLTRLADEQTRFLTAWTEANRSLHPSAGQSAKLASIQLRLTQEFLDAQRSIVRRRAETDVAVTSIAAAAAAEGAALLDAARSRASVAVGGTLPPPTHAPVGLLPPPPVAARPPALATSGRPGFAPPLPADRKGAPTVDDESLARLIDGVFESSEPDGVAARRELRELLDGWWRVENQEAQAAIDDAHARAAMHVHLAKVEADELDRFAPPALAAPAPYVPRPPAGLPAPLVSALDDTDQEHLDEVLAHLLDSLGPKASPADVTDDGDPGGPIDDGASARRLADPEPPTPDSLNDPTGAPQEAFDRFWGSFTSSGSRGWRFPQLLMPAVTVIAVLALVLAVVG